MARLKSAKAIIKTKKMTAVDRITISNICLVGAENDKKVCKGNIVLIVVLYYLMQIPIEDKCKEEFERMKMDKVYRYIIFSVDKGEEERIVT